MPPPPSQRLTSSRSFDRIEGEGSKAFEAFVLYRNMGPGRTIESVAKSLGRTSGYERVLCEWSSDWNWVERAKHWDDLLHLKAREIADEYIPIWEQRRQVALEGMMLLASKLLARGEAMLNHPITKEVTRETNGGQTIYNIVEPAGWTWSGMATVIKVGAELQAATIAEGLMMNEDDLFDVESATEDQLRDYLRRAKARRGPKP